MTPEPVIVTELELTAPPAQRAPAPAGVRMALMRVHDMPVSFYRYLADESSGWTSARQKIDGLSKSALSTFLGDPSHHLFVLYVDGAPGGWFALTGADSKDIDIAWLFCLQSYEHRGMVRYLISAAIDAAFGLEPDRVSLTVRSDDRPQRLTLYQRAGFAPVARSHETPPTGEAANDA
ncbi:MAG: GNAT family N-acetyltransferase [Hyphomicrobiales bacterium]